MRADQSYRDPEVWLEAERSKRLIPAVGKGHANSRILAKV